MNNSNSAAFFYEQKSLRERPKRCRKLPEELPESLKFAHLNPKVAALLANKERQQKQEELNNLANLEKHGVDIGNTFQHLKNQFDSVFVQDEDSQRFLFESAKGSSGTILEQLSQLLWIFKDVLSPNLIPKSLEYQLMMSYKELTADVIYLPRDWQTVAIREQFLKSSEIGSEDGHKNVVVDNEAIRQEQSVITEHIPAKKRGNKTKVAPGHEGDDVEVKHEKTTRRSDSKNSTMTSRHKNRVERTGSASKKSPAPAKRNMASNHGPDSPEMRGGLPHLNTSVIHFELSSKLCEDKGWIMNKGDEMQIEREQVLEWCIQILQKSLKTMATQKEKDVVQDKPVQVRYYGDTRLETLIKYRRSPVKPEVSPAIHGGSPRIPKINDDKYEGKNLMLSGHSDGTSVVYYPSGRPAIVYSSASHGRPGYYTLVYDDDEDMKMLGCFTPIGTGCVYHDNGTVWFLATSIGGHLADKDGLATKKWKWPTGNVKIPSTINLQLNKAINFRCAAFSQMSIVYNFEKESAKFLVSASAEAVEPNADENDQLLTTFNFTSNAAKELLRLSYSKLKMKKKKDKDKVNGESDPDIPKLLEIPEVTMYGTDAEKDYAKLLRKGKGLIDDWMETYRTAFGFSSPCLHGVQDVPTSRKRYSQSAKPSRFETESRGVTLGIGNKQPYGSSRIPSAPAGHTRKTSALSSKAGGGSVKFDDDKGDSHGCGDGRKMSLSLTSLSAAVADVTKLFSLSSSPRSRIHSARPKSSVKEPIDEATVISTCETCPVVLCQRLMGMTHVNCRCSRYLIPNITDIEFDLFISKVVPNAQLQVITVVSSLFPKRNEVFELLEKMYTKQNRNRMRPCQQCYCDTFRLLKYDINTAADHSDHTQPLLLTRHNAVPGMILIYSDGNLLFCDNIFNGYGNTKKDFKKQITKSRLDAVHGVFLPKDFRFKPSQGHHGPRSAWGGEIGGAGVDSYGSPGTSKDDVILHRPSSSSTYDGQVPDKLRGLDASNFICLSLSPMGYRPKSQIVRTRHKLPTAVK
ncbi:hypothetical protein LOTGIDRAFT_170681 [Lottia gigantea]|uniref:FAM194 C-terminal domain-containing protein n=1 Tax=Lottia gigantea TaxID=225164 RepID=V4CQ56_LOTGI|nr:hypothetical protein LOTGIDRAFT_170681 [Lottia gigantea]ESP04590.1 hypothetical protein LOTGIDRAFT_170681 [Lottia gigantea]